jgi:hypothetical protein
MISLSAADYGGEGTVGCLAGSGARIKGAGEGAAGYRGPGHEADTAGEAVGVHFAFFFAVEQVLIDLH